MGSLNELEKDNKGTSNETLSQNKTVNVSDAQNQQLEGKISYAAQKKREKLIRKSEKEVSKYEAEIEKFENKIQEIEQKLATQTEYDASIYEEHAALKKSLENTMSLWKLASEEFERVKAEQ